MSCTNCYNGCAEIVSDQCVKYTGIDVPALGISNGDTLATVEQALASFLNNAIIGTGIKPIISPSILCDLIKSFLPTCTSCTGFDLNQILTALIQATCSLQTQVNTIDSTLAVLNADYTIGTCLSGVTASSDTHAVLQAVINTLCSVDSAVSNIVTQILPLYVLKTELPGLIQNYLNSINLAKNKMIPYTPIPYFGPLSNYPNTGDSFDNTGVGSGYWDKIYLCNGLHGTPDLRGRTLVGATTMGANTFPSATNPAISGNPTYSQGTPIGANQVALTSAAQLPPHNHTAQSSVTDPGHIHTTLGSSAANGAAGAFFITAATLSNGSRDVGAIIPDITGITVNTTIDVTGNGLPHDNIQPSIGSNFIIYIP